LAGSIRVVLPVAFISFQDLTAAAGGLAAAFIGQVFAVAVAATDEGRREAIATGGLIGLPAMIGLILYSAKWE
jgi:predicted RecA/RadA family phage recombinase